MDVGQRVPLDRRRRAYDAPMPEPRQAGREPPHNLDLERSVLAVVLSGQHAVAVQKARQHMPHPLMLWSRDHRLVWMACLELDDGGHPVDAPAVADLLGRIRFDAALDRLRQIQLMSETEDLDRSAKGRLRRLWAWEDRERPGAEGDSVLAVLGGAQAVYAVADAPGSMSALERNAQLVRDYYLKRRIIARLGAVVDEAHVTPVGFSELVTSAGQVVLDLARLDNSASVHGMDTVAGETLEAIVERRDQPNTGVLTGMADIDARLMSLRPGGLYVLAARPGVGKTSLALRIVQGIVSRPEADQRVLFFSLEVDRRDLVKKLIAAYGKLPFKDLDMGTLPEDQWARLEETLAIVRNWPMEMMDVGDLTVHQLRSVVKRRQLETQNGLKLIVIDYLQLLQGSTREQEEYAKISEISRVLKMLSREANVPVLALSQMSRDSEKGSAPREPRLSDLRGSGSIEQDADAVLFIHRVDNEDREGEDAYRTIKIKLAKNRFGPTGDTMMRFFPAKLSFEQAAPEDDPNGEGEEGGRVGAAHASRGERLKQGPVASEDLFSDDAPTP